MLFIYHIWYGHFKLVKNVIFINPTVYIFIIFQLMWEFLDPFSEFDSLFSNLVVNVGISKFSHERDVPY